MLVFRLNCDASLANLSTRTCISLALCDIRALSSTNNISPSDDHLASLGFGTKLGHNHLQKKRKYPSLNDTRRTHGRLTVSENRVTYAILSDSECKFEVSHFRASELPI